MAHSNGDDVSRSVYDCPWPVALPAPSINARRFVARLLLAEPMLVGALRHLASDATYPTQRYFPDAIPSYFRQLSEAAQAEWEMEREASL